MIVAVPKECKNHEYRVGLTPATVRELCQRGHHVLVQRGAGSPIGFSDPDYQLAGAELVDGAGQIFARGELIIKVKEPQPEECRQLRPGQCLFTYLHLAADRSQTEALLASGVTAIAYETVTDDRGGLPLLAPMSEVAGRLAIQAGATSLEMVHGGRGQLLGGVPGVAPAEVCIIGGGVVGTNAALMATGLGASVTIFDRSIARLQMLDNQFRGRVTTLFATADALERQVQQADLVVGAVLIPGGAAPKLVTDDMVKAMKRGAAIVDVAIDQGGCFATSRPTSHATPRYVEHGVVHYCVTNIPGAVARTATQALNNAILPYVLELAELGWQHAVQSNPHLRNGLNISSGKIYCQAVAEAHQLPFHPDL